MHLSTLPFLAISLISTAVFALPSNPKILAVRQNVTCTPGESLCQDCPPLAIDGVPNCIGVCDANGTSITITEHCPTLCTTECQFPSCPLVCA